MLVVLLLSALLCGGCGAVVQRDGEIINQIKGTNVVLDEIKELLKQQIREIVFLKNTVMECEACGMGGHQPRPSCVPNPCHPGVQCMETPQGVKCGPCPDGMVGNGTHCTDVDECTVVPCHMGVRCVNTAPGFRCGACPAGYTGPQVQGAGLAYATANKQRLMVHLTSLDHGAATPTEQRAQQQNDQHDPPPAPLHRGLSSIFSSSLKASVELGAYHQEGGGGGSGEV
ncbi:unnamed protein product [Gadus morhua 'NCC']